MFSLVCSVFLPRKRRKTFHEIFVKILTAMTDVGMVQFTTTMAYDNLKEQTSTILAQKSAAVLWHCYRSKDKIPRTLKRFVCKLLRFLFNAEDFVGRIGIMLNITPLRSPDIFYNHASRSQKGKILRWNKHAGHQADPVSVHCLQTTEQPRDKMRIHLGCSTTHGPVKLVPHWIPQFHQIVTSSASSKTKTGEKFFLRFRPDIKKS